MAKYPKYDPRAAGMLWRSAPRIGIPRVQHDLGTPSGERDVAFRLAELIEECDPRMEEPLDFD